MTDPWTAIDSDTSGEPLAIVQDSEKTWIYCSREVWKEHILARHPEVESLKDLIIVAIENPRHAEPDPEDRRVMRYYADVPPERAESRHSLWLRVVVKYVYPPERDHRRTGVLSSVYLLRKER